MYSGVQVNYTFVTKKQLSLTAFITRLNPDWHMAILISANYELYNTYIEMLLSFKSIQLFR